MTPRIELLPEKKLIGKHVTMSWADNKTGLLWGSFMPARKTITNTVSPDLVSMTVYNDTHDFTKFDPRATFDKWAAVEVTNFDDVPQGMETFVLPQGLYAVFQYKGSSSEGATFFSWIFTKWLPQSGYILDNRPHFEILGEKYKNNDPGSEEEIWIPVQSR